MKVESVELYELITSDVFCDSYGDDADEPNTAIGADPRNKRKVVTFNPSKVEATAPTFVPSTYQTPPTSTLRTATPTGGYPTLYHETFGSDREIYPAIHKTTHKHQGTNPNHREVPQENHPNHQKTHPNHQEEYSGPHHGYRHRPATHQEPKYHEIKLPHEETRGSGADDADRPEYFSSFSENVNHIREEYDSQKEEERATFAPPAAEDAPLAPVVNTDSTPVAAPAGSPQNSNSGKGNGGYPQKLKKVMRKKRYRPQHPRQQQHDFSFAGIGSTLDSALGSAIGSVGKFLGGVTRSTNNLHFEKFPVPFIPSATLQPEGQQQKRETIPNSPQKDDSGSQTAPGKDAAPLQDYSGLVDPRSKTTPETVATAAAPPQQPTSSYLSNEHSRPTPTLNFIPNENSAKANSHKKKAVAAGPITYAPYRRKTPAFVRDVVAKYSYVMSLLGK